MPKKTDEQLDIEEWKEFSSKVHHTYDDLNASEIYNNPYLTLEYIKDHMQFNWNWDSISLFCKFSLQEYNDNMYLPWNDKYVKDNDNIKEEEVPSS